MTPQLPAPPAWLKDCAPSSTLNVRDVLSLLHVSRSRFERMLSLGQFPRADRKSGVSRQWTVSLVLRALNEAQRAESSV